MAVYIPSFQVLLGRPRLFLPSGFQWIIIFDRRVGSILSTWPYQISCFRVMSSNIISCASIFPLIYSYIQIWTEKRMSIFVSLPLRITSFTVANESFSRTLNTAGASTHNSPPSIHLRNTNFFVFLQTFWELKKKILPFRSDTFSKGFNCSLDPQTEKSYDYSNGLSIHHLLEEWTWRELAFV